MLVGPADETATHVAPALADLIRTGVAGHRILRSTFPKPVINRLLAAGHAHFVRVRDRGLSTSVASHTQIHLTLVRSASVCFPPNASIHDTQEFKLSASLKSVWVLPRGGNPAN